MGRVRIKDIAEIAHVSTGTVDRVIHNRGEVSPATREKVLALVRDLDYKPDIAARSLALKREIRLAVVMPGFVNDHSFWKLPHNGIQKALSELSQYQIELEPFYFDQTDRHGFRECIRSIVFERTEGILFAPVFLDESLDLLNRCEQEQIPVVLFNSMVEAPAVKSFVGQDAFQSGMVAARLIDYGLESGSKLVIVNMSTRKDHYTHITDRERGFRSFFKERPEKSDHLFTLDLNGADDRKLETKLDEILGKNEFGGVFVTNSRVHKVARYLELHDKDHINLIGYDLLPENIDYLERNRINFLLSQKPGEQAYFGLTSLFNLVVFNREPEKKHWLPIDIITRDNLPYYQSKSFD